jgi:D-alanyl-D-alanine carboxypeptidase
MRVKDKKRFIIACSGLVAIVVLVVIVLMIGFMNRSANQAVQSQSNSQSASTQTSTTTKETDTNTSSQQTTTTLPKPGQTQTTANTNSGTTVSASSNSANTTDTDSITVIVNKNHSIPADYVPADLVTVDLPSTRETRLRSVAADALKKLFNAATSDGYDLSCCSGYRSYDTQAELYQWNVDTYGVDGAELVSARPGMSEHQLGLAMDVTSASVGFDLLESFGSTPEGQFLKENAYKYGFIIRYPQGKTDITGYAYEPWHLRYVGVDVATAIYNSGKTMEEYFGSN